MRAYTKKSLRNFFKSGGFNQNGGYLLSHCDDRTIGGGVLVQRNDLSAFHSFSPYRFYKRDAFRLA